MITDYDVFKALRGFVMSLFPDVDVVRTLVDDVPMPKGAFVAMNDVGRQRIATNITEYHDPGGDEGEKRITMKTDYAIQLDFYGDGSAQRAQIFSTLFFDSYAYDFMPENIKPLHCTDPVKTALITGEEKFMERWRMTAHLQINPVVTVKEKFFDTVTIPDHFKLTPIG